MSLSLSLTSVVLPLWSHHDAQGGAGERHPPGVVGGVHWGYLLGEARAVARSSRWEWFVGAAEPRPPIRYSAHNRPRFEET